MLSTTARLVARRSASAARSTPCAGAYSSPVGAHASHRQCDSCKCSCACCMRMCSCHPSSARSFSTQAAGGDNVVVPLIANSLEFTLSSPPPLHQFQESPLVVETEHLDLHPGKEAEEVLAMQGHTVTDIIGKEKWVQNDPEKYAGLIPQNENWTEFVDEKTGEWVYLDEYGNRVEKP